jgi:hypothetical protein
MITFYKLRHATDATKQCYVGSTKNFGRRKSNHKYDCNNPNSKAYNIKVYAYIRANDGYDNWCFDALEEKKDMSKRDRHIREGILIEQHHATLNANDPAATVNGISTSQKRAVRKYYNAHKEKFAEYYKQRNNTINICEKCGVVYRGLNNKYIHQRTKKCQRLALQRIQPVINIDGDNNTVTVNITVTI